MSVCDVWNGVRSVLPVTSLLLLLFLLVFEVLGASAAVFNYMDTLEKSLLVLAIFQHGHGIRTIGLCFDRSSFNMCDGQEL